MAKVRFIALGPGAKDEKGKTYGRLKVLGPVIGRGRGINWLCRCKCGRSTIVSGMSLRAGNTKSCGCRIPRTRHGESMIRTAEYRCWQGMHQRCYDRNAPDYAYYGARGIRVNRRWHLYEHFLADMGRKPSPRHTIERKNNKNGYSHRNCKWALPIEQGNNRRSNRVITFKGRTLTMSQWARVLKIKYKTLAERIRQKWPLELALTPSLFRRRD